jgi:hypothetical protein
MRGVRHWGGCDWHVAGGSRARVWGRGEVFPRGEPRSHPEVSPRGENLRCRYFGTVPQIVGGNGLPVRDCARYRGDVRPCWVQPIYTMSDTSRGRQRGARTRGGAARGAAPTADPGGAPGTANPTAAALDGPAGVCYFCDPCDDWTVSVDASSPLASNVERCLLHRRLNSISASVASTFVGAEGRPRRNRRLTGNDVRSLLWRPTSSPRSACRPPPRSNGWE